MLALTVGHVLVVVLVLVIAVLGFVPATMFTFGLWWLHGDVFEDPARANPGGDDPDYERRFREFEALGFRPVGMTNEAGWFISPLSWFRQSLQGTRWMRTPDGLMLATFHRLYAAEPVRFGVMTLNDGGGFVRTTCPGVGMEVKPTAKYARFEMPDIDPEMLVARHRENVDSFCRERGLVSNPATFREAAAAALALDRLAIKGRPRGGVAEWYRESRQTRLLLVGQILTLVMVAMNWAVGPLPELRLLRLLSLVLAMILAGLLVAIFVIRPISRRRQALRSPAGGIASPGCS